MSRYWGLREQVQAFVRAGHPPAEVCRELAGPRWRRCICGSATGRRARGVHDPAARANMAGVERRFRPSWELKRAIALRRVRDDGRMADLAASSGHSPTAVRHRAGRCRDGGTEALMSRDEKEHAGDGQAHDGDDDGGKTVKKPAVSRNSGPRSGNVNWSWSSSGCAWRSTF